MSAGRRRVVISTSRNRADVAPLQFWRYRVAVPRNHPFSGRCMADGICDGDLIGLIPEPNLITSGIRLRQAPGIFPSRGFDRKEITRKRHRCCNGTELNQLVSCEDFEHARQMEHDMQLQGRTRRPVDGDNSGKHRLRTNHYSAASSEESSGIDRHHHSLSAISSSVGTSPSRKRGRC